MRRRVPLYHVWFATKGRKWILQGKIAPRTKEIMQQTAREKGIQLLECETMVDHTHPLLDVADGASLSRAMNLLKGVASRRLSQEFPELKMDGGVAAIWQHRYAAKEIPQAAKATVAGYIRTQWERPEKYER